MVSFRVLFLRILVLAVLAAAAGAGCRRSMAPVVWKIEGDTVVTAGDSVRFQCYVWTPRGAAIDYHWECNKGRLSWNWGNWIWWFAPDSSGSAVVRVTVNDTFGDSDTDSVAIVVLPLSRTVVSWNGAVKRGTCQFWAESLRMGERLEGRSDSDTAEVYLLVLDQLNFGRWQRGEPAQYRQRKFLYFQRPFYDTIPVTDRYYFVVDNTQGGKDVNFWVRVTAVSP